MIVTKKLNIYYRDYAWFSEEDKYLFSESDLKQDEKCILVGTVDVKANVTDMADNPELLKQKQIAVLQAQQEKLKEIVLKELQELEDKIQTLKGIEYIPE